MHKNPRNLEDVDSLHRRTAQNAKPRRGPGAKPLDREGRGFNLAPGNKSEGNFLYVQQVLEGVERGKYGFDQLDALPPGLFGLYQAFFERTFPDESAFKSARRILDVVVCTQSSGDRLRRDNSQKRLDWMSMKSCQVLCDRYRFT